jgi:hypothetical protein
MFGTLQGRLPKELSLLDIGDIDESQPLHRRSICRSITNSSPRRRRSPKRASSWPAIPQASPTSCASSKSVSWLAVFHGPRRLARYSAQGAEIAQVPTTPSVTPCSPPSRRGLSRAEPVKPAQRRPSLTASARVATWPTYASTSARRREPCAPRFCRHVKADRGRGNLDRSEAAKEKTTFIDWSSLLLSTKLTSCVPGIQSAISVLCGTSASSVRGCAKGAVNRRNYTYVMATG